MSKLSFLHTHYLPYRLLEKVEVEASVVALEVYPDLLQKYYGEYDVFTSLENCISWHKEKYEKKSVKFSIENIAMLRNLDSLKKSKDLGLITVQLFHSQSNLYFNIKNGLTDLGYQLLHELIENDIVLDLSHLNDDEICYLLHEYDGKIVVSHCVCSDIIETIHPRTNAISRDTIYKLADRGCLFGIPFVNDLVSKISHDTLENDPGIICDIVSQIVFFTKCAGAENVALGPDFMDMVYFSKVFKQDIRIPDSLFEASGYQMIRRSLREKNISDEEISLIMSGNVNRFLKF